jgi:DNA-binding CsgD family transcriptional regulator
MRKLRCVIAVDSFWFATADPETLLFTDSLVENLPEAATPLFVANELLQDDVSKWVHLAATKSHVDSLALATKGHLASSTRYRDVLTPLGFGDELRAVLHDGHSAWGFSCLHRGWSASNFSGDEMRLLASLVPHLAQGLRSAALLSHVVQAEQEESGPGLLLLADDFLLMAATPAGEYWLSEISDERRRRELPHVIYGVVGRLLAEGDWPDKTAIPRARVQLRNRQWLTVHASRMTRANAVASIAIILEPARPREIAPLLLGAYGLTSREAEIVRLVLRGFATAGISAELSISQATVQQHLKSIFDKTGVGSRRELVAQIFASHYRGRATV